MAEIREASVAAMNIYIDESGTFSGIGRSLRPSVVGGLVVPDSVQSDLFAAYASIRDGLTMDHGEVKGRQLSERQVALVINTLRQFPVIFEVTAIDLGLHTPEGIEFHRNDQAEVFKRNMETAIHQSMRDDLFKLGRELEKFPLQLYVQSVANFDLIHRMFSHAILYFAQRIPEELRAFNWVIDAKDRANPITSWERWWSTVIPAMIQSKSEHDPWVMLKGADYSYFQHFETGCPEWAFPGVGPPQDPKPINVKKLLSENFRFSDEAEPGLELVDVLTNALRRALTGNLREEGWDKLPCLMVHRPQHYFELISLQYIASRRLPYDRVASAFQRGGRSMIYA